MAGFTRGAITIDRGVTIVNAATYLVLTSDQILSVTYTATGACTITMPSAAGMYDSFTSKSLIFTIQDTGGNAVTNNITINPTGVETINGNSSYVLNTNFEGVTIWSNGTALFAI